MEKIGSLTYQVESALKTINLIAQSKHEEKQKIKSNKVTGIYGIQYFRKVLGGCILFVQHVQEHFHIKSIFQLRAEHYVHYIEHLQQKEVTNGYITNVESYVIKLQTAMRLISQRNGRKPTTFIDKRLINWRTKEKPKDRSYTPEEIDAFRKHMSPVVAAAMDMSVNLGFRTVTLCNIRVEHVVPKENGNLRIEIVKGTGITKGGRFLYVDVPEKYEAQLRGLISGKEPYEKILKIKENSLRKALSRACKETGISSAGFHGFRHTYARNRLEQVMGERFEEGKVILTHILKNHSAGRRADHGIPKDKEDPDREWFDFVEASVNVVHSELGHGKSRWALVAVYMS